jgi:hypothetical protein
MIDGNRSVDAALAWRSLPLTLRTSLVGVCHWDSAKDKLEPLLDFIVMAEPPGGPLATAMFLQLNSEAPELLPEMKIRGLMEGIPSYALYSDAIRAHDRKRVRFYAESGFSVNGRGAAGVTPLMAAGSSGDVETLVLLLDLGANADARDDNSLSASDYARRSLKVDAAEFLSLTSDEKAKADKLKRRFSPARQDSPWIGLWIATSKDAKPPAFAHIFFGQDGTFDMPPGPAGSWVEDDSTHLTAKPMLSEESSQGASRTLFGDLTFERLEEPARIRVKYFGEILEFGRGPDVPAPIAASNVSSPETEPDENQVSRPKGLKAVPSLEKVSLTWDAAEANTRYLIFRDGALLAPEFIEGSDFTDTAPPGSISASYTVRAADPRLHLSPQSDPVTVSTILKDTDGKGLPDRWQMRYFGHLGVDPNADPDADGLTNLQEYKGGTDPNDYYNGVEPVVKPLYGSKPGPQGQLAMLVLHPDGRPWINAPATFRITSGGGLVSAVRDLPPFLPKLVVRTDDNGLACVYLKPPSKP